METLAIVDVVFLQYGVWYSILVSTLYLLILLISLKIDMKQHIII